MSSMPHPAALSRHPTIYPEPSSMDQATSILIVDPDLFLQEMITAGFRLFDPGYTLLTAVDPAAAHEILDEHQIELVISEIRFAEASSTGLDFIRELSQNAPQLPVIVLTEAPGEALDKLPEIDTIIAKPPDMDLLLSKVNKVIHANRESILRGISLESFLQVLEIEKKTATLTVTAGRLSGCLYLRQGELIHAETAGLAGKKAAFAILSWSDYSIKISETCLAEATINGRLNALLMEWCVMKDHGLA